MSRSLAPSLSALLLLTLSAQPATAGLDRWTSLGPEGGTITVLAADPGSPGTLYAGANGGVWKSTDGGDHWRLTSQGLPGLASNHSLLTVHGLVVDPETPGRIFALTGLGTFRSLDGGATWQRLLSSFGTAGALAVSPGDPDVILATVGSYVLRSDDGGEHWVVVRAAFSASAAESASSTSLAFSPADPSIVYATLGRVFRSTNAGLTWRPLTGIGWPLDSTQRLALDPTDPRTLYVMTYSTTWKSTDAGATWLRLSGLNDRVVQALVVDPADPSILFAGGSGRLWRSEDAGETWKIVPGSPPVVSLEIDPALSGRMWIGSDGVFRSVDSGRTWQACRRGLTAVSLRAAAFDPFHPAILYVVEGNDDGWEGDAFRSTDRGATWSNVTPGTSDGLYTLAPHPLRAGLLFAASERGVYRSPSRGTRWSRVLEWVVETIAFHPRRPNILFAGGENRLFRSLDGGRTWDEVNSLPSPGPWRDSYDVVRVAVSPLLPATVFVLTEDSRRGGAAGLLRSANHGRTWTFVDAPGTFVLASHPTIAGLHYLAAEDGGEIWRSRDDGVSWERIAAAAGGGAPPTALLVDRQEASTLYLGTDGSGVWRSTDGGFTWEPLDAGMTAPWITCLDADPRSPRHLIACTHGGGLMEIRLSS